MSKNVQVRKGRGRGVTREQEREFLYWLERCGTAKDAAVLARTSYDTMAKRRQRNAPFRAAWEKALSDKLGARVELFFACLEKTGQVKAAYLACELTEGWFYSQMLRNDAFRTRVKALAAKRPNALWEHAVEQALQDNVLLIRVLDRFEGNNQPTKPRGG